ncbi:MAG: M23 family metallopeptidase [Microbacteriaceae bacterium]|nr:M23 family metallopeptidase [Microbacteriaceae bacterium]
MSGRRALERVTDATPAKAKAPKTAKAAKPRTRRTRSSVGSKLLSLGAMVLAGALALGLSVPASLFGQAADALTAIAVPAGEQEAVELQTVEVSSTIESVSAAREEFDALSWAELLVLKYGTRDYTYSTTGGTIRWPFPTAVKISSGFGERVAPCMGCSSMHMGLDFQPPNDSPVYAIAAGTVAFQEDSSYGYGNHVIINHGDLLGDGHNIVTLYAHMQHGSVPVRSGDQIQVGDFLGLVGRTGTATGIHMHFEVLVDGVQVDPFTWLKTNTN